MRNRTHAGFDPSLDLVAARRQVVQGAELFGGDPYPLDKDGAHIVPEASRRRLWVSHWATYARDYLPTPVEAESVTETSEEDEGEGSEHTVDVEHIGGGNYSVRASWLPEAEKIKGKALAEDRAKELLDSAPPPTPPVDSSSVEDGSTGDDAAGAGSEE